MVRKKVRTVFLLFQKKSKGKEKGKNSNLTFQKKSHGTAKGKSPILTFQKKQTNKQTTRCNQKVRRTQFYLKTNKQTYIQTNK